MVPLKGGWSARPPVERSRGHAVARLPFAAAAFGQVKAHRKLALGDVMLKKLVELLLCFLHPVAVILMWIDLATRTDLKTGAKVAWAIFGIIPLIPFVYVLTGGDLF
jgi:hypothetical protein